MGEVTEDEVAVAKERGLEVEPEEVTELQPLGKTVMEEELLLTDEQRNGFLDMESPSGDNAVKVIEMTVKD